MSAPERLQELERLGAPGQWAVEPILPLTLALVRLKRELEAARIQIQKQAAPLEASQRQAPRQAAPFRRPDTERSAPPGRPGRKAGPAGCSRPKPEPVGERIRVNLDCGPHCQGSGCEKPARTQYIEEIPGVRPRGTELTTAAGGCEHCQCEAGATHPLQVRRASGAAGVQLGPRALALACDLNQAKGLSRRKTVAVLHDPFGWKLTPGGLALLGQRGGRTLAPEDQELAGQLRRRSGVHADETNWWVGGPGWWLWVFCTPALTLYVGIQSRAAGGSPGRAGSGLCRGVSQ